MGVAISYWTTGPVDPHTKQRIMDDADRVNASRAWCAEPICFFEWRGKEQQLSGHTKLFLLCYSSTDGDLIDVEPDDDTFMAARDLDFIVDQLTRWSRAHELGWELN